MLLYLYPFVVLCNWARYNVLNYFDLFSSVDHSRVRLETVDGLLGSDYINANFCDVSTSDHFSFLCKFGCFSYDS